ncbi:MAG: hypothetical protein ACRDBO_08245 [Lachnospiraceae bacterium]
MLTAARKRIIGKLKEREGITVVELLITFALTAILMTAVMCTITSGIRAYTRTQDIASAISVSNLILDKVTGELAAAQIPEEGQEGYYLWLAPSSSSSWAAFCSKNQAPAVIYTDSGSADSTDSTDGRLCIKYYETEHSPEKIWGFESAAYMGFQIKDLSFSLEDSTPGLIKINLTLHHKVSSYEHHTSAYALAGALNHQTSSICRRNDGKQEIPAKASEFTIQPSSDSEETGSDDR